MGVCGAMTRAFGWIGAMGSLGLACAAREPAPAVASAKDAALRAEAPLDDPATCVGHVEHEAAFLEASQAKGASGRLPAEQIRDVVRSHYPAFQTCYEQGLARHGRLNGRVTVRFVIEEDGTVASPTASDSLLPDCTVIECVRSSFEQIEFPPPEGGIVTVQYPVQLELAKD